MEILDLKALRTLIEQNPHLRALLTETPYHRMEVKAQEGKPVYAEITFQFRLN